MTISQAFELALQRHRSGRLAEAEALYRQILAAQPEHAEALHFLGVIAYQSGRHGLAVEWIRQAVVLNPGNAAAHSNLGEACRAAGRLDEAADAFRVALRLNPDLPEAHNNLGGVLRERGQLDEAVAACRRALELKPGYPEALSNLGNALRERGQFSEAAAAHRRALELKPDFAGASYNLGVALWEGGQPDEAIAAYRRALELKPDYSEALVNLGVALRDRGQPGEAVAAFHRALQLEPNYPEAHSNLGIALRDQGQLDEAVASFCRAIGLKPGFPEAHYNLGIALRERGQLDDAIAAYRRALELKPNLPEAHNNLGIALTDRGELGEGAAAFRRALQLRRDSPGFYSDLIYTLHFHPSHDPTAISEECQRWDRQFGDPWKRSVLPHASDPAVAGRLRIGYVSPDFRDHPVGRYVLPLFERHDRGRFEIFCYSGVLRPDWITERLRALAAPARDASRSDAGGGWRSTVEVPDARLAEMIREDGVDILVDLAMHTAGNRLPVFARQPAPVQVSWLAYPGSTGLHSIGYRLTDAHMDPPGGISAWSTDEPVRLPDSWCCYDPVGHFPEINALPALSAEGVTFGSLNNFAKVHEGVLALWARVLDAVKGSRLMMLCPEGQARERVRGFFGARGIGAERVEWVRKLPRAAYLGLYQQIDLGLDPFPYNGMTTTCDALWMGAPVLTLPGVMPVSRAGFSLLSSIGLAELAASSEEDYVRIAVELAGDLPRLAELRATLRARMLASPLMDAPRFARNAETAYRSMWQAWSSRRSPIRE